MQIRRALEADAGKVSDLIRGLSHLFALSPDGEEGEQFFASISKSAICGYITAQNFSYLMAEERGELAGVVAIRDQRHLYHLFVAPAFQGRGLGRLLWSTARDAALSAGNTGEFTVNSSPNAFPVYERFGFMQTGPRAETHGVTFIPMKLVLARIAANSPLHTDAHARQ